MEITLQPIQVAVGSCDEKGPMVLVDGTLVAVLVDLTSPHADPELQDTWFVQAGFGPSLEKHELYSTLDEEDDWALQCYLTEKTEDQVGFYYLDGRDLSAA
jgi:hypothetical protein